MGCPADQRIAMAPGSVDINVLPGKEAGLFRQLVKQYEVGPVDG